MNVFSHYHDCLLVRYILTCYNGFMWYVNVGYLGRMSWFIVACCDGINWYIIAGYLGIVAWVIVAWVIVAYYLAII